MSRIEIPRHLTTDATDFGKSMARARDAVREFAKVFKRPKVRHVPRRSGVGARQVLQPWTGKALRHPWAHERDTHGRVIPLVPDGGPLPQREV